MTKDYVQAYKWLNLATAKGDDRADDARINLASAERFLTPEQVAEAQRLAHEFKPHKASAPEESPHPRPTRRPVSRAAASGKPPLADTASAPAEASKTGVVNV